MINLDSLTSLRGLTESACIAAVVGLAFLIRWVMKRRLCAVETTLEKRPLLYRSLNLVPAAIATVLVALLNAGARVYDEPSALLSLAQQLSLGWLAIVGIKQITNNTVAAWFSGLVIIPVTLLHAFGLWPDVSAYLDSLAFQLGEFRLSLLRILKTTVILVTLLWLVKTIVGTTDKRLRKISAVKAGNRTLILKALQILLYFILFIVTLNTLGVDLTALAVFGGALGVGLGFGLQKIASNFVSGIILLFEKSVEIDDLVELNDGTFGFVRELGGRATLVQSFDGKELLVPNEDFITQRVVNWTYTNMQGRIDIPVGVSYGSDIEKASELMLEAAREHPNCSKDPEPKCFLRSFGNSSVDFLLLFWIDNIIEGRWEPQSEVMFSIWRKFKENGIEIPFPQRDLNLKNPLIIKREEKA